jgi:TolB-like protein/DNA-binding winged helix-turn-helix (wHTH) protein/Flp pilus assembly protein TadD
MERRHVYAFGPFRLDADQRVLLRGDRDLRVTPRDLGVLLALVARHGQIVDKERIFAEVWGDVVVEEGNLARHVATLRQILGDSAQSPTYIETVQRRGYRFIGPVEEMVEDVPAPVRPAAGPARTTRRWIPVAAVAVLALVAWGGFRLLRPANPAAGIRSVVVLPLVNLTGDPAQEHLADAMTELLLTDLGRVPDLHVVSRTSAMQFKGTSRSLPSIARELGVEGVIEGAVVQAGGRIAVTAQLIDARSDRHLWAERFEADEPDVLRLGAAVSRAVLAQLPAASTRAPAPRTPPAVRPEAFRAWAQGRALLGQRSGESVARSVTRFEEAVAAEPEWALAHASLSEALGLASEYRVLPPASSLSRSAAAALRALEIDPDLAEAHVSLAAALQARWDWDGAEREYRRAIELQPGLAVAHQWYGELLTLRGRHEEAIASVRRARDLDPVSLIAGAVHGITLHYAGRSDEAVPILLATLELDPRFAVAHEMLGRALDATGRHAEAVASFRRAVDLSGRSPEYLAALARSLAVAGEREEARALLAEIEAASRHRFVSAFEFAMVLGPLGERDRAFGWLDRALEERSPWLPYLDVGEGLPELRGDPRYAALVDRIRSGG